MQLLLKPLPPTLVFDVVNPFRCKFSPLTSSQGKSMSTWFVRHKCVVQSGLGFEPCSKYAVPGLQIRQEAGRHSVQLVSFFLFELYHWAVWTDDHPGHVTR